VPDGLQLLADGSAELTRAMGLDIDLSGNGMGLRSRRYALYAVDGVVQDIWVEAPGEFKVSSAEQVLQQIPA
jgi:peroxiredoxin